MDENPGAKREAIFPANTNLGEKSPFPKVYATEYGNVSRPVLIGKVSNFPIDNHDFPW